MNNNTNYQQQSLDIIICPTSMQSQAAYKPLSFILTQTIGLPPASWDSCFMPEQSAKQLKYKDILIPKSVGSLSNLPNYYLFHTAPIYNYLRNVDVVGNVHGCKQKQMLQKYLLHNDIDKQKHDHKETAPLKKEPFDILANGVIGLTHRFQVLRKCLQAKIRILKQLPYSQCNHYIKLSTFTHCYLVEESSNAQKSMESRVGTLKINRYYCKQCQKWIDISVAESKTSQKYYSIQQYPIAPILPKYHGNSLTLTLSTPASTSRLVYRLCQVYTEYYVLIMAANDIWYISRYAQQIGDKQKHASGTLTPMKICNNFAQLIQTVARKASGAFVYLRQDCLQGCGLLKEALPMAITTQKQTKDHKNQNKKLLQAKSFKKSQMIDEQQQRIEKPQKIAKSVSPAVAMPGQQAAQLQPLVPHPVPLPSLLNNMPSTQQQQYLSQLQKLYPKQKQKDEYEKDYDKGKTKKIKKKMDYVKPNFNQIFHVVKKQNQELLSGAKEVEKGNKKKKKREGDKHGEFKKEGKDRFRKGFNNGKFRNGKFGNKKFGRQIKKQQKQQFLKKFQAS